MRHRSHSASELVIVCRHSGRQVDQRSHHSSCNCSITGSSPRPHYSSTPFRCFVSTVFGVPGWGFSPVPWAVLSRPDFLPFTLRAVRNLIGFSLPRTGGTPARTKAPAARPGPGDSVVKMCQTYHTSWPGASTNRNAINRDRGETDREPVLWVAQDGVSRVGKRSDKPGERFW